MPLLFLDEVDDVCASLKFWSSKHRAPVEFRRSDFIDAPSRSGATSLRDAVIETVASSGRPAPTGRIAVLANLRSFGWQFNPIALYFCYDAAGSRVEALVAEVTNTPWKQRHCYVVDGPGEHRFEKQLHVSPFMTMNYAYHFSYGQPGETLGVVMSNYQDGAAKFRATLNLNRTPLTARNARTYARSATAPRVSAAIYLQALRLRLKGVPFIAHPDHTKVLEEAPNAKA